MSPMSNLNFSGCVNGHSQKNAPDPLDRNLESAHLRTLSFDLCFMGYLRQKSTKEIVPINV